MGAPPPRKRRDLLLPDGWDDRWRAAKASGLANLLAIGDSVTNSQPGNSGPTNTADWLDDGYTGVLRDLLAPKFEHGLGAEFFGWGESVARNPYYHWGGGATPRAPWYFSGTQFDANPNGSPSLQTVLGPNGKAATAATWTNQNQGWWYTGQSPDTTAWTSDTTYMAAFSSPYADTLKVELLVANYNGDNSTGATFKFGPNADGSGATTQNIGLRANYGVQRITVYSGAAAQPTVYFGAQGHANDFTILGAVVYRHLTAGLRFARMAFTGRTAGELTNQQSGQPADRVAQMVGGYGGTGSLASGTAVFGEVGFPTAPDLLLFALGINDCNQTLGIEPGDPQGGRCADPDTYGQVIAACIDAGRLAVPDMSALILVPYYPPVDYQDSGTASGGFAFGDSWPDYQAAAQEVGRSRSAAVALMNPRWGSTPFEQGFLTISDATGNGDGHPAPAGYADMAAFLAGVL